MARSRSRTFPAGRLPAKKLDHTLWQLSTGSFSAIASGATAALGFSSAGTTPATLLRMRGEVLGFLDAVQAPGRLIQVNYGIILVPEGSAADVQFAPLSDANAPWLLYGTAMLGYEEAVTDVIDFPGLTSFRHVIDNKAMRIIRPDVEMQFVVENTTLFAAATLNLAFSMRWLQGF